MKTTMRNRKNKQEYEKVFYREVEFDGDVLGGAGNFRLAAMAATLNDRNQAIFIRTKDSLIYLLSFTKR